MEFQKVGPHVSVLVQETVQGAVGASSHLHAITQLQILHLHRPLALNHHNRVARKAGGVIVSFSEVGM